MLLLLCESVVVKEARWRWKKKQVKLGFIKRWKAGKKQGYSLDGGKTDIDGRRLPRFNGHTSSSSRFDAERDRMVGSEKVEVFLRRFKRAVSGIGMPLRCMCSFFDWISFLWEVVKT